MGLAGVGQKDVHQAEVGSANIGSRIALRTARRYTAAVPVLASPDDYLFAFEGETAIMLAMDRAAYRRSIFLDDRIEPASEVATHPAIAALSVAGHAPVTGWIFHVAHCGSTLLARALDQEGASHGDGHLVLREPLALRQLGIDAGSGVRPADWHRRLALVMAMLARRYDPAAMSIVKANVPVNFIIADIMAKSPGSPALLLHFPLADYLAAILRSEGSRLWLRGITDALRPAIVAAAGALPDDDAGRAAALWLAQMRVYADALARFDTCHSLDAEMLFARPDAVLSAASRLFGVPMSDAMIAASIAGPLFNSYSKNPAMAFDDTARRARHAALADALAPEIAAAREWVAVQTAARPLPDRLPRALVASERLLLD